MASSPILDLERQRPWQGQRLKSADFNRQQAHADELAWWHNRALHDAFGIAKGLTVASGENEAGLLRFQVAPGLAFDSYGRELLLAEPRSVMPPREARLPGGQDRFWTLLLRYPAAGADSDGCGCSPGAADATQPELVWRRGRLTVKDGVALARGRFLADEGEGGEVTLRFEADPGFNPFLARPMARPRIVRGATVAGGTDWRLWQVGLPGAQPFTSGANAFGIEVTVDTADAGFARTPCYFAWLHGGPWQLPHRRLFTLPLERITATARDRFTFNVWLPSAPSFQTSAAATATSSSRGVFDLARRRLYVCWLGIERPPGSFAFTTAGAVLGTAVSIGVSDGNP